MATKTRAELVNTVLKKLFIVAGGETADASDYASALDVIANRSEWLKDEEIIYWADDAIPLAAFDPLAEFMLFFVAPILLPETADSYAARSQKGEQDLRRHVAKRSQGAPIQTDYF